MPTLRLVVDEYRCEPCSDQQGTVVRELVRMAPRPVVFNGRLVADEWWCCPICFTPQFDVRTGRRRGDPKPAKVPKTRRRAKAETA